MDVALKEWAVTAEALAAGRQTILLRKGGIAEGRAGFRVRGPAFLLFPTFEHQHASFIRPEHEDLFERARRVWRPGELRVELCAEVAASVTVAQDPERLMSAADLFIWNERYVRQRCEYRPDLPLQLLLLRVSRLPEAVLLPMRSSYAGCKSWVNLTDDVPVEGARAVLTEEELGRAGERVRSLAVGVA